MITNDTVIVDIRKIFKDIVLWLLIFAMGYALGFIVNDQQWKTVISGEFHYATTNLQVERPVKATYRKGTL